MKDPAIARSVRIWTTPLPSRTRRRRNRRAFSSMTNRSMTSLPLVEQTGDVRNGDGDAGLLCGPGA